MMFQPQVQKVIDKVDVLRREVDDHWQIPSDEAMVLAQLVRARGCRSACEIGTSYGFSTLHLAAAVRGNGGGLGGRLHAIEAEPRKVEETTKHLKEAGLSDAVTVHEGRAQQVLADLKPERPFEFVFLDAVKEECFEYLQRITPYLADRCVIATDNTDTHWKELSKFVLHLRGMDHATSCNVSIGNGFELTVVDRSS